MKDLSYETKAHLKKIGRWMIDFKVAHLSEALSKRRYLRQQDCQAAELSEFLDFL